MSFKSSRMKIQGKESLSLSFPFFTTFPATTRLRGRNNRPCVTSMPLGPNPLYLLPPRRSSTGDTKLLRRPWPGSSEPRQCPKAPDIGRVPTIGCSNQTQDKREEEGEEQSNTQRPPAVADDHQSPSRHLRLSSDAGDHHCLASVDDVTAGGCSHSTARGRRRPRAR